MNRYLIESLKVLEGLEKGDVEYLIIGGVAVNIHGFQQKEQTQRESSSPE